MFILQEKVNGKFENVSGKFQYGEVGHAQRRAEKEYGGKLYWEITGLSRTFEYGKDRNGKIFYQIIIRSDNPMDKTEARKHFAKLIAKPFPAYDRPKTKAMYKFLEKEAPHRVIGLSIETDGVFIYTDTRKWSDDAGAGTFRENSETEAIKQFYERVQPVTKNPAKKKKPGEAPYKHKGYEIWNMSGRHWAYRKPRTDNYIGQFKTVAAAMNAIDKLKTGKNPAKKTIKMKPETIKRRAAERKTREKAQRKNLEKRLSEKAKEEGPNSIWAEMLDELRSKNPDKRFTVKQLSEIRKNFGTIKGISPESKTYKDLIVLLDSMPQVQLKQLAGAKIKFISGLALNRIKRKGNPVKKKRSAKQLANDKRLGRMAKARAKKKRALVDPTKRKRTGAQRLRRAAKPLRRNPQKARPGLKKSHLWYVFKCYGKQVRYLGLTTAGKSHWTIRDAAVIWKTKGMATNVARSVAKWPKMSKYDVGVASSDMTSAQIAASCRKGKA